MTRSTIARRPRRVPAFALYGEAGSPGAVPLHIEEIASRSRLYHWEIAPHVHQGLYQIVWLRAGGARLALDVLHERIDAPAAVVVPPAAVHGFHFAEGTQGWVLTLSPRTLVEGGDAEAAAPFEALFDTPAVLRLADTSEHVQRIEPLLRELAAEAALPSGGGAPVAVWLARCVVWRLAHARRQQERERAGSRRHEALFARFVALVEQHHLEQWPVTRYADRLGLSTERLNRLTQAQAGCSALELLHERLTREACRRLLYIAAPVSTLAFELGFTDPAYFCRFFKRRTGFSPSAYRRHQAQSP